LEDPDPLPFNLLLQIFDVSNLNTFLGLLSVLFLLLCSAFISGAEVAYFSLSSIDKDEIKAQESKAGNLVLELLKKPKRLLATILITNNFVNIGIVVLSTFIANKVFDFTDSETVEFFTASVQEFLILVVLLTFLILFAGEVTPKVYATKNPIKLSTTMAYPILVLEKICWSIGLSRILIYSTSLIDKRIKKKPETISVEDLSTAYELTSDQDVTKDEQKILDGIVKFGNTDVKQIMKPRLDVVAFDIEKSYKEVLGTIIETGYSRIPVFKENFDKVEGTLYTKDLLPHINEEDNFGWNKLIRPSYFVPENKKIDDLLREFQEKKIHLAIVVDEYGGTSGIVTLEDIIEEIVGDITDEFDDDELKYSKLDENNYVFEGKTQLNDIYRVLEIDGENFEKVKGESDTVAGFLLELSGKLLQKNEKVIFENYTFTIEAADKRRIKQIKITIKKLKEESIEK
jgi:putative hemolysin